MAAITEAPTHTTADPPIPRVEVEDHAPTLPSRAWSRLGRVGRRLAAIGGGAVAALATPPWGFWPLGIAGIAVLAALLAHDAAATTWRGRWLTGFWWAAAMFGITLFWMSEFHAVGYVAATLGYAAFYGSAVAALPLRTDGQRTRSQRIGDRGLEAVTGQAAGVALLPAALVTIEWLRHRFPFGGVPLGSIELGQAGGPLAPLSRLFGGLGVLLAAAVAGTALGFAAVAVWRGTRRAGVPRAPEQRVRRGSALLAGVAMVGVLIAGDLAGLVPGASPTGATRQVAAIQGGGERGLRAVYTDSSIVFERHRAVSADVEAPIDLVVWPENAIDVDAIDGTEAERTLQSLARRSGATVVAGVTEDADGDRFVNVAYAWDGEGRRIDGYTKVKRVPFGEYVPGRALFERLVDLSILPRDARPGAGPGVLETPAGTLGVAISYEVFFADRARDAVRAGAEVLLVPTNASSFTTSQVPTQQVAAARLRALETGRWVVQAAPTGYSAIIDPDGRVVERSVLGEAGVLTGEVGLRTGLTPYAIWGDLPAVGGSALALALAWSASRRRRPTPALDQSVNF